MNMSRISVLIFAAALSACNIDNNKSVEPLVQNHVVVLAGQSNMVGINQIEYREPNQRILSVDLDGNIVTAVDPLFSGKQGNDDIPFSDGGGPGTGFADSYITTLDKDQTLTLVPCAREGSSIYEHMEPNQTNYLGAQFEKSLLNVCIERSKIAMSIPNSKFIGTLYWQGETDAMANTNFEVWEQGVQKMKETYQSEFDKEAKFVFAQIAENYFLTEENRPWWENFKSNQYNFSVKSGIPMIQTDDVCDIIDGIHCSYQSSRIIGERFFQKIKQGE